QDHVSTSSRSSPIMGEGIFGQVTECLSKEMEQIVAVKNVKITKNSDYVLNKELSMLRSINSLDLDKNNIAAGEHYMEFEMLDQRMLNLLEKRKKAPFSLSEIRPMAQQLFVALDGLRRLGVMHTNILPDNIMFVDHEKKPFKLIDFGVAVLKQNVKIGSRIEPSVYLAPEVTLTLPLTKAVDIWSLGCCLLEWYLWGHSSTGAASDLKDAVLNYYEIQSGLEYEERKAFLDLVQKMLDLNPNKRISPDEALQHFIITMSHSNTSKSQISTPSMSTSSTGRPVILKADDLSSGSPLITLPMWPLKRRAQEEKSKSTQ
uniref:Protein kinase domain-containing protein n=1 Tax=Periophthalmus magnuspinnatus TaxID=409849 RepID=A0A3B4A723_9GOBI